MRKYPDSNNASDLKSLEQLKAAPWQIEMLKKNPEYVYWGNNEDHMSGGSGLSTPNSLRTWDNEALKLDEYNEIINFYFQLNRDSHTCPHCDGAGVNPATRQLSEDWYDFEKTGRRWCDKINDNEVEALIRHGRIPELAIPTTVKGREEIKASWYFFREDSNKWEGWVDIDGERKRVELNPPTGYPSAVTVNTWGQNKGLGHDAINRWICIEARAKSLGVYGQCEHCEGEGHIYDADCATLQLQLWVIHPRKGASQGVFIEEILESEIPEVLAFLTTARERNFSRFAKL